MFHPNYMDNGSTSIQIGVKGCIRKRYIYPSLALFSLRKFELVVYLPGVDVYGGCAPCAWSYIAPTSAIAENDLLARATDMKLEKRAVTTTMVIASNSCTLSKAVTFPAYTGPAAYISMALSRSGIGAPLPSSRTMSRWFSKTTEVCAPLITTTSDSQIQPLAGNGQDPQRPSIEHVCEWRNY